MTIDDPAAVSPGEICDLLTTLPSGRRWLGILTGWRGRGKTTWCSALASVARARGLAVAGLLSPGIFDTNSLPVAERIKLRIDLVDLATGYSRVLATPGDPHAEGHGMRWHFIQETIAWGNAALSSADAADLVIIDELGPLELTHGRGLTAGVALLDEHRYSCAVVVIRPELVAQAQARWPEAVVLTVPAWDDE